jgi:hypothetical protein
MLSPPQFVYTTCEVVFMDHYLTPDKVWLREGGREREGFLALMLCHYDVECLCKWCPLICTLLTVLCYCKGRHNYVLISTAYFLINTR